MGTILILGLLVGSIIGGHLGDHFGRKKAIFGSIALTVPVLIGSGYVNNYNGKKIFMSSQISNFLIWYSLP